MNLKIGSALKALAILIGLVLGADVISDTKLDQIAGALTVLATIGWDMYETFRLQKQGVVSTSPLANVATEMTPAKLVAEEKAEAKADAKAEAKK